MVHSGDDTARALTPGRMLVTSAGQANGDGFGALLGFTPEGVSSGPFSRDGRIVDPRGLSFDPSGDLLYLNSGADRVLALDRTGNVALDSGRIDGLDPGGAVFGPDGRFYLTLRQRRTILALPPDLEGGGESYLPAGIVPFPRGFGFGPGGELYLASGVGPSGVGDNTIAVFEPGGDLRTPRLVDDPGLSPLDLTVASNGHIVVASESPFGASDATATVREYDPSSGALLRVFTPDPALGFARPRGLRFGPGDRLYCVGRDHVVAFDFSAGTYLGVAVRLPRLNGQAVVLLH